MASFINSSKYATILTEDIPGNDSQMRFIADKHVFQLTGTNTDTYSLSNIVGYDANQTIMSMVDNWVGIGTTVPVKTFNKMDIYGDSSIVTINNTSVGIRTSQPTADTTFSVYGSAHITDNVGIGTFYPKEKLQVYGNIMAFSFKASGGDYSEWELLAEGESQPEAGSVIGFNKDGRITSKWSQSKCFGIISVKPSIIGNQDLFDAHPNDVKIPIVYMGKINLVIPDGDEYAGWNENIVGEAGDFITVMEGVDDTIKLGISQSQSSEKSIGYIRRKISKGTYEVIVRI